MVKRELDIDLAARHAVGFELMREDRSLLILVKATRPLACRVNAACSLAVRSLLSFLISANDSFFSMFPCATAGGFAGSSERSPPPPIQRRNW